MTSFESAAKKLCRLSFWGSTIDLLGGVPEKYLYAGLAGPEAGDFRTLRGFGVPIERIALFDTSVQMADDADAANPDQTVIRKSIEGGITDCAPRDAILLDFGTHIDNTTLSVVRRTAISSRMTVGRVIGMSFLVGRELHATWLKKATADFVKGQRGEPADVYAHYSRPLPCMSRALYVTQQLYPVGQQKLRLHLKRLWMYEAREDYGTGSHVLTLQYQWQRAAPPEALVQVLHAAHHANTRIPAGSYAKRYVGKNTMFLLQEGGNPELLLNISAGSSRSYRGRSTAGAYV
jgi:hypothetical protein